jgi:hypothetical protein
MAITLDDVKIAVRKWPTIFLQNAKAGPLLPRRSHPPSSPLFLLSLFSVTTVTRPDSAQAPQPPSLSLVAT